MSIKTQNGNSRDGTGHPNSNPNGHIIGNEIKEMAPRAHWIWMFVYRELTEFVVPFMGVMWITYFEGFKS